VTARLLRTVLVILSAVAMTVSCRGPAPRPPGWTTVAGYLVPWDSRSRASAADGVLTELSPVWYRPTKSAEVVYASDEAEQSVPNIEAEASARGLRLIPTISNSRYHRRDGALIDAIIDDPRARSRHVAAIVDLVRSHGWDGIDIDYESLPATARDAYSRFVRDLASALHAVHARLSVTLHAKTSEPGSWRGAQAQDWRAIGASADQVRVMAYDHATSDSSPGSIAPRGWVDEVLTFAVATIPRDRVVLGLATYGYDWPAGRSGTDLQWADVQDVAAKREARQRWDDAAQSPWLKYIDDRGRHHTVWFENARSLALKLDTARRYSIAGVVVWRLGGEDPGIWDALRSAHKETTLG
jgi:spore germination protein